MQTVGGGNMGGGRNGRNGTASCGMKPRKPIPLSSLREGDSFSISMEIGRGAGWEPIALRLMRSVMSFLILQELRGSPLPVVVAELVWPSALAVLRRQRLGLQDLLIPPESM